MCIHINKFQLRSSQFTKEIVAKSDTGCTKRRTALSVWAEVPCERQAAEETNPALVSGRDGAKETTRAECADRTLPRPLPLPLGAFAEQQLSLVFFCNLLRFFFKSSLSSYVCIL